MVTWPVSAGLSVVSWDTDSISLADSQSCQVELVQNMSSVFSIFPSSPKTDQIKWGGGGGGVVAEFSRHLQKRNQNCVPHIQ